MADGNDFLAGKSEDYIRAWNEAVATIKAAMDQPALNPPLVRSGKKLRAGPKP